MRLVDRKTFLSMPAGTVYAKYTPCILSDIQIKYTDESLSKYEWEDDWWYIALNQVSGDDSFSEYFEMENDDSLSYPLHRAVNRDGLHDSEQMFMIYEKDDIDFIVSVLRGE